MGDVVRPSGLLLLASVAILVSACEYAFRGSEQEVSIQTEPAGAEIALSDGRHCTSPCRLTAARYRVLRATISKAGCRTTEEQLTPAVAKSVTNFGTVYDYQLGDAYDLEPNPLTVVLSCGNPIWPAPPTLTSGDEALIGEFTRLARTADETPPSPDGSNSDVSGSRPGERRFYEPGAAPSGNISN